MLAASEVAPPLSKGVADPSSDGECPQASPTVKKGFDMDAPVLTYSLDYPEPHAFGDLATVRLLRPVVTDDGQEVPEGAEGTVVGVWGEGAVYEVEFAVGLATVEVGNLDAVKSGE